MEEKKMTVYEKLAEARVRLQNTKLNKSGRNTYAGFNYFELADFLPLANEVFLELKLCSSLRINDNHAVLRIFNAETSQEDGIDFICPFSIPESRISKDGKVVLDKMQCIGAAVTYVRRYLYVMALEIVESDMLEAVAGKNEINNANNVQDLNNILDKYGRSNMAPELKRMLWEKARKMGLCFSEGKFAAA